MATLNFHVRHEVQPHRVWDVINALATDTEYDFVTQYDRQISRMRKLNIVTGRGDMELTKVGQELYRIGSKRSDVLWDLLHYLHYIQWEADNPTEKTMFFTYQKYCDVLYERGDLELSEYSDALAAEMESIITSSSHFSSVLDELAKGAVSFSTNSLKGVEHWLEKLSPEVIQDGQFSPRHYCSPELMLMAIGYVNQIYEAELGLEQSLTEEKRDILKHICFLEDEALDQIIDWLLPEYPDIIQPGTTTGSYGRFIKLLRQPTLEDLLR
jgi:hypothetical protein